MFLEKNHVLRLLIVLALAVAVLLIWMLATFTSLHLAWVRMLGGEGPSEHELAAIRRSQRLVQNQRTITNSIGMELIEIPAGAFTMGAPASELGATASERAHHVTITSGFFMGRTEVTQQQWMAVMDANPSHFRGATLPVDSVTWNEAKTFCERLSAKEGRRYRLPTEAEWEYACRAGTTMPFSFGLTTDRVDAYAWTNRNSNGSSHIVGQKRPNPWGLYDMHGNVLEWCQDWWSWRYPMGPIIDPTGPESGSQRVTRGGRWSFYEIAARSAARDSKLPQSRYYDVGFRVVLEIDE